LIDTLEQALSEQLQAQVTTIPLAPSDTEEERCAQALLLIELLAPTIRWIPFYASSTITVEVVYASDGDISWRYATSMINRDSMPVVHARGKLIITDQSKGLISIKAYRQYLGKRIAEEIYQMVKPTIFDPPGS
jgi:hypothetical protein